MRTVFLNVPLLLLAVILTVFAVPVAPATMGDAEAASSIGGATKCQLNSVSSPCSNTDCGYQHECQGFSTNACHCHTYCQSGTGCGSGTAEIHSECVYVAP